MSSTPITPLRIARPGAGPRLITDTPVLAVLDRLRDDLGRVHLTSTETRAALEHYYQELTAALRDATATNVWVSVEEAARLRGCSPQAITALCRKGKLEARKRGGVWEIHKDEVLAATHTKRAG